MEDIVEKMLYAWNEKDSLQQCVKVANDHAIDFMKWIANNDYATWNKGETWFKIEFGNKKEITTEQLLEIYNNQ